MLDLSVLNKEQLLPVMDTEGAVLVTAGAGSGKTRLLTYRIANLIQNLNIPPYNVLAITFTNKAAREMKDRLIGMMPEAEGIFISTFHSMCVTILRRFIENLGGGKSLGVSFDGDPLDFGGRFADGENKTYSGENKTDNGENKTDSGENKTYSGEGITESGARHLNEGSMADGGNGTYGEKAFYTKDFSIYDESERKKVIKLVAKQVDKDNDNLVDAVSTALSRVKNAGKDIGSYADDYKFLPDVDDIVQCMYRYRHEMLLRNALDFDDLLAVAYDLLAQSKQAREYYQRRFRYIHVDEFQDTNVIQYKLIKILSGGYGNIFAVGDEDQSIYGWRGANIENIRHFIKDFDCRIYKLEQNYRSTKSILQLANSVIKNNSSRIEKKLWTENDDGIKPQLFVAGSDGDEADFIMQSVKGLYSLGQPYRSMAVLMRINALSRSVEQKFMFYGIPYRLYGGFKFYDRKEIKDVLAYLKLVCNNKDDEAAMRVIAFPKKGIGDTSLSKMLTLSREKGLSLYDIIISTDAAGGKDGGGKDGGGKGKKEGKNGDDPQAVDIKRELGGALTAKLSVLARQLGLINENKNASVSVLLKFIYNLLNLNGVFSGDTEEDENRKLNVRELINSVVQTERQNPDMDLSGYLQQIMLYSDLDGEPEGDCVCLFTVHSAKGLEFDTVFIIGAEDGLFPLSRSMDSPAELEEERRLMYVAMTRAKKRLFVSHTRSRFLYGQPKPALASRFLYESGLLKAAKKDSFCGDSGFARGGYNGGTSSASYSNVSSNNASSLSSAAGSGLSGGAAASTLNRLPSSGADIEKLKEGTKIKHKRLGAGIIKSVNLKNKQVDVEFDSIGLITLSVEFAPITVLD